jgi:ElaB/YqjD/DUF883 family membrane-anchored ribosome-binding protein
MDTMVKEGTTNAVQGPDSSTLAELRKSVNAIAEELSAVAEERARALKEGTQAGANSLRRSIRRQPVVAIGIAALAGALLALAVVPRLSRGRSRSRWEAWAPHVTRADLYDVADNIQRSLARATSATAAPLASSLERLVEAFSKIDSKESLNEMIQKAGAWFQRPRSPRS